MFGCGYTYGAAPTPKAQGTQKREWKDFKSQKIRKYVVRLYPQILKQSTD